MDAGTSSGGISDEAFLGAGIFLILLTSLCVAARFVVKFKLGKKTTIADYFAILAISLLVGTFINFYLLSKSLSSPTSTLYYITQLVAASGPISASATWAAKAPIFLLFIQVFSVITWLRITSYISLVVTLLYLLGWNIWVGINCVPYTEIITPTFLLSCTEVGATAGVAIGGFGVATDVLIFLLPIPVILRLHLPLKKKIGLALVFLVGIFGIVASAVALHYKRLSLSGISTDIKAAMILTIIELSIAIMVGCVPVIHTFWSSIVTTSALYIKIQSAISSISISGTTTSAKSSKYSKRPRTSAEVSTHSGKQIIEPHAYGVPDDKYPVNKQWEGETTDVPLRHLNGI